MLWNPSTKTLGENTNRCDQESIHFQRGLTKKRDIKREREREREREKRNVFQECERYAKLGNGVRFFFVCFFLSFFLVGKKMEPNTTLKGRYGQRYRTGRKIKTSAVNAVCVGVRVCGWVGVAASSLSVRSRRVSVCECRGTAWNTCDEWKEKGDG